jgi:hypothetical protein
VRELKGQSLGEAGDFSYLGGYYAVAQDHVPLEATGGRVGEAAALPGELLRLADVVEDGPKEK